MPTLDELLSDKLGASQAISSPSQWREMPASQIGAGWGAGVAGWKAGMGALAGAIGFDTEDFVRRKQEESNFYARNAPGATNFFGAGGVADGGSVGDWLAYNFGQSAPYMLEMIGGAGLGSLALKSARGAAVANRAVELAGQAGVRTQAARTLGTEAITGASERAALEAAKTGAASRLAMGTGGALASYPSAVGDILKNQLDAGADFDEMQLGTALAGGIPYAALNLLGGEAAIGRALTGGMARKAGVDAAANAAERGILGSSLDYLKATARGETLPGAVMRGGARAGTMEGLGETGQEVINQTFGRMAVNPDEGLFTGDAPLRYAESFAAGFGMGGIAGGGASVFAKPTQETPDAIAQRADTLSRSLEQINQGNQTWRETLDQGRKEEAEFVAEREAAAEQQAKDMQKAAEQQVTDAKKQAEDRDKQAVEARDSQIRAFESANMAGDTSSFDDFMSMVGGVVADQERAEQARIPVASFDIPNTGFVPPPLEGNALVEKQIADLENTVAFATEVAPHLLPEISSQIASLRQSLIPARPPVDVSPIGSTALLKSLADQMYARAEPLPEPGTRAARRAPMNAIAQEQRSAAQTKAAQEEQLWAASNADPRYGMVQDMFGRTPDYPKQAVEQAETAPAEQDTQTINMFQLREGEKKPRVTLAAKKATAGWFQNPPPKATKPEVKTARDIIGDLPMAAFAQFMYEVTGDRAVIEQINSMPRGSELSPELKNSMASQAIASRARAMAQPAMVQGELDLQQVSEVAESKLVEMAAKFNNRRKGAKKPKAAQPVQETVNDQPTENAETVVATQPVENAQDGQAPQGEGPGTQEVKDEARAEEVTAAEPEFLPSELQAVKDVGVDLKVGDTKAFANAKTALAFVDKRIEAYNQLIADLTNC